MVGGVMCLSWGLVSTVSLAADRLSLEEEGQALAAELRSQRPVENLTTTGLLKRRDAAGKRSELPVSMRVILEGPAWTTVYETPGTDTSLAQVLRVSHSESGLNAYKYSQAPAVGEPAPVPEPLGAERLCSPFVGSDFSLADLGLEFFHWPAQRLVKKEMRKGRSCKVLESRNPAPGPGDYARVLSWIDFETHGLLRAEAYDQNNRLAKEFSVRSFKKVNGRWQLKELEIRNPKTDSRTRLEFDLELE
jgi:hypothetical protein